MTTVRASTPRTLLPMALRTSLLLPALLSLAACEPCSGVVGCEAGPRLAYEGRIVDPETGAGVAGVEVQLVRTGGVELDRSTLRATTSGTGGFSLETGAAEEGEAAFDVSLSGPGGTGTSFSGLQLRTVRGRGEARSLDEWVLQPYVETAFGLYLRATRQPLADARVEFRPTGGVPVTGGRLKSRTDPAGNVALRLEGGSPGEVQGTLLVTPADSTQPYAEAAALELRVRRSPRSWGGHRGVGPWLGYSGGLVRADGSPAAGVEVTVRRTGGVPTTAPEVRSVTNAEGRFTMELVPLAAGVVTVQVLAHTGAAGEPLVVAEVEMPTYQSDEFRDLGTWSLPAV